MTWIPWWFFGLVLVSIQLGSISPSSPREQSGSELGPSAEEYEIYSAVITQKYVRPDTKLMMIEDRTFRYDFSNENDEPWRDKFKDKKTGLTIDQSAAEDYETKNSRQSLLNKASFKLPVKVTLIGDLDLRAIFHGKWGELEWINYYRKYPDSDGFLMLSRIGFNTERTQALLYLGSRCGPGCGEINFLLLEKTNGSWSTKKELRKKKLGS
jgi:hypothetical protein